MRWTKGRNRILSNTGFEVVSFQECELPMKKAMWQAHKGSRQLTTSNHATAHKELNPVNSHISLEADSSLVEP